MKRWDILGEIVGIEEGLFLLLVERVRRSAPGRARVSDGRKIELAQFSLSRQQTSSKIHNKQDSNIVLCELSIESVRKNFTYAISSFLDRSSSSRSIESISTTQHPINVWKMGAMKRAISFTPKKSLESDEKGGVG
jgi:hypothetical protein